MPPNVQEAAAAKNMAGANASSAPTDHAGKPRACVASATPIARDRMMMPTNVTESSATPAIAANPSDVGTPELVTVRVPTKAAKPTTISAAPSQAAKFALTLSCAGAVATGGVAFT